MIIKFRANVQVFARSSKFSLFDPAKEMVSPPFVMLTQCSNRFQLALTNAQYRFFRRDILMAGVLSLWVQFPLNQHIL